MPPMEMYRWICPGCSKAFKIPRGKRAPELCNSCRRKEPPEDVQLIDPAVHQVESIEIQVPSLVSPPQLPQSWVPAPGAVRARIFSALRLIGLTAVALATLALAAWPFREMLNAIEFNGEVAAAARRREAIWKQAKEEISKYLLAPKTASFPESGEIRPWGGDPDSFEIESIVDSQNAHGVPIRSKWKVSLKRDDGDGSLRLWYAELDGSPVYADPEIVAGAAEIVKKKKARLIADREARRAAGGWRRVATFDGRGDAATASATTTEPGFRLTWDTPRGMPRIQVYDASGGLVTIATTSVVGSGEKVLDLPPGTYSFHIRTASAWSISVWE